MSDDDDDDDGPAEDVASIEDRSLACSYSLMTLFLFLLLEEQEDAPLKNPKEDGSR